MREIYSIHCVTNVGDYDAYVGQKLNGVMVGKIFVFEDDFGRVLYVVSDTNGQPLREYINCPVVIDYHDKEEV